MPFKDIEKRRTYRREWYYKNKKSEIAHVVRRKKELKKWILDYKKTLKCSRCSENHPSTIDFHHNLGKKEMNISQMVCEGYSRERIKKEVRKCEVLCSNCHRKEHSQNSKL